MCSKGKFCEEYMALLRAETSGGAGLTRNFMTFLKSPDSVVIRIARLRWAGHVARMDEKCMSRRLMYLQPKGLRKVGRPRDRWRDDVGNDARMLGLRSWWATALNREEWRKLLTEAKTLRVVLMMMIGKLREISSTLITQKVERTFGTVKGSLYWRLLP
jgi:hypothetical protein